MITCRGYKSIKNYNYKEQIHLMHYTSPAHPQEKKQEYQIDYPQGLVEIEIEYRIVNANRTALACVGGRRTVFVGRCVSISTCTFTIIAAMPHAKEVEIGTISCQLSWYMYIRVRCKFIRYHPSLPL